MNSQSLQPDPLKFFSKIAVAFVLVQVASLSVGVAGQIPSGDLVRSMSLGQALDIEDFDDTMTDRVYIDPVDLNQAVHAFEIKLRPDFLLLVSRAPLSKTVISLVAKKESMQGDWRNLVAGQQVMQWQVIDVFPEDITGIEQISNDGRIKILVKNQTYFGLFNKGQIKTKIVIAKKLNVEPTSYENILSYLKQNPRQENSSDRMVGSDFIKVLFGRVWVKIFDDKKRLNSLEASKAVLKEEKLIVQNKVKVLHVSGQIFTADLIIAEGSPYTGQLAPGRYLVIGRLSSGLKNLNILDENGKIEKNSLAIGLLVFRTRTEKEVPGVLFLQDSLAPLENPGLVRYQMTNNPGFLFKPSSVREFFEQGLTILGVAASSFLSARDSGRGVQGNYRSTLGLAANSVDLLGGDSVVAPRFLALQFQGRLNPAAKTHIQSMSSDPGAQFVLRSSEDGKIWSELGKVSNIVWSGIDSHELTFPHGLSGTINPQVLKAAGGNQGIRGLELPAEILPSDRSNLP